MLDFFFWFGLLILALGAAWMVRNAIQDEEDQPPPSKSAQYWDELD